MTLVGVDGKALTGADKRIEVPTDPKREMAVAQWLAFPNLVEHQFGAAVEEKLWAKFTVVLEDWKPMPGEEAYAEIAVLYDPVEHTKAERIRLTALGEVRYWYDRRRETGQEPDPKEIEIRRGVVGAH